MVERDEDITVVVVINLPEGAWNGLLKHYTHRGKRGTFRAEIIIDGVT